MIRRIIIEILKIQVIKIDGSIADRFDKKYTLQLKNKNMKY
jgi:hypothetical protein